ncbi:unnamed protein product, partial [Closterium sp. Naga37s-1]
VPRPSRRVSVPDSVDESVQQARAAVRRAREAGHQRLMLDLLLPLIGPSLLDDWPGGIQQQLQAAIPLVESLLTGLVDGGELYTRRVIDEDEAVVAWESKTVALVLFPTAERLPAVMELVNSEPERTLLLMNPQWQPGQVVSDFGFGSKRKQAEEFLGTFLTAYSLKRNRIRSYDVTLIKCFPGDWQTSTERKFRHIRGITHAPPCPFRAQCTPTSCSFPSLPYPSLPPFPPLPPLPLLRPPPLLHPPRLPPLHLLCPPPLPSLLSLPFHPSSPLQPPNLESSAIASIAFIHPPLSLAFPVPQGWSCIPADAACRAEAQSCLSGAQPLNLPPLFPLSSLDAETRPSMSLRATLDAAPDLASLFTRFTGVQKLVLKCERNVLSIDDASLDTIARQCVYLRKLKLKNCRQITDDGMERFARACPELRKFSCGSCGFGLRGLNALLNGCAHLEDLTVKRSLHPSLPKDRVTQIPHVSDSLSPPANLSLKRLCLKDQRQSHIWVPLLQATSRLETLILARNAGHWDQVLGSSLGEKLTPELSQIYVERVQITDKGLQCIGKCPKLEALVVVRTPECTDAGMAAVAAGCSGLKRLHVEGWAPGHLGDPGLSCCSYPMPALSPPSSPSPPTALSSPASLPYLCLLLFRHPLPPYPQELLLVSYACTVSSLQLLASNCPSLERLTLCSGHNMGDPELATLAHSCSNLPGSSPSPSSTPPFVLPLLPYPQELLLVSHACTVSSLQLLASNCPSLERLTLCSGHNMGVPELATLAHSCSNLPGSSPSPSSTPPFVLPLLPYPQELLLVSHACTVSTLQLLASNCPSLERLTLCSGHNMGDPELATLAHSCSNLLWLSQRRIRSQELLLVSHACTVSSLQLFASNCPSLERLTLCSGHNMGDPELATLAYSCSNLRLRLCLTFPSAFPPLPLSLSFLFPPLSRCLPSPSISGAAAGVPCLHRLLPAAPRLQLPVLRAPHALLRPQHGRP